MSKAKDVLKQIEEQEIEWVDLRFTDPKGKWQHLTMTAAILGEDELADGLMFDGSSIAGWKVINESDMILKPDLERTYIDPFSATPMMILFCDIVEPSTGDWYARDPRTTAKRAENYLKSTGIGDTIYVGPEAEFFMFDDVRSRTVMPARATRSTTSSCRPTPVPSSTAAISRTGRAPRADTSRSRRSTAPPTSAARWSRR